jgi:hypothetical protein
VTGPLISDHFKSLVLFLWDLTSFEFPKFQSLNRAPPLSPQYLQSHDFEASALIRKHSRLIEVHQHPGLALAHDLEMFRDLSALNYHYFVLGVHDWPK